MKKIFILFFLPFCFIFSGCVFFKEDAKVSSYAAPGKFPKEFLYTLESRNPDISPKDLEFMEYGELVAKMLAAKGYKSVPAADANCVVKMDFGISKPEAVYSQESIPVYGTVGYVHGGRGAHPVQGVVGYNSYTTTDLMYSRYFTLECWSKKEGKIDEQLWKTNAWSYGLSGDFHENFPMLALATFPWIGKSSDGQKTISEFSSEALEKLSLEMKKAPEN